VKFQYLLSFYVKQQAKKGFILMESFFLKGFACIKKTVIIEYQVGLEILCRLVFVKNPRSRIFVGTEYFYPYSEKLETALTWLKG